MMSYDEFTALCPQAGLEAGRFPYLLLQAECIVQSLMVYAPEELAPRGLAAYRRALALQIEHIAEHGASEGSLVSQTVGGVSARFALAAGGADAVRVSPLAKTVVRSAGLCVRA